CNYLEKILARSEARNRGFDECVQLNERGEITSGAMANLFWLKDERLFTPSRKTGCVPGITRLMILETLKLDDARCVEVETGIGELDSADEIYVTSAGLGIVQVAEFHGRRLECNDPFGLTQLV
ncbi:MAG TPA: aminotransferase class IV, partial [Pyrinomonadaceae bacterium]|nr:aminotransferase class IV [Pyrinomonadaceae bacterium]